MKVKKRTKKTRNNIKKLLDEDIRMSKKKYFS